MKPEQLAVRSFLFSSLAAAALAVSVFAAGGSVRAAAPQEGSPSSCDAKLTGAIAPVIMPVQFGGAMDPQYEVSCNAMQEFTYMNWRAKGRGVPNYSIGPSAFGYPVGADGTYTTVWESYVNPDDLFRTPTALKNARMNSNGVRTLSAISKGDGDDVHLNGFHQADFGWLTSRRGDLTFYEERVDNDEVDYITKNGLTSAAKQRACAAARGGLSLPDGTKNDHDCNGNAARYGLNIGAVELKAAWVQLHDTSQYSRYLISRANLVYPDGSVRTNVVIGLVGLHIIHKTGNLQQLSWATFEHVDNDPDATPYPAAPATTVPASPGPTPAWTYRNPHCVGPYCQVNHYPTPCATGNPPGCQRYTYPTQTERVTPQSSFASSSTTTFYRALAKAGATRSVFRYYRLIDVQWPAGSTTIPPGARVPLTEGSPLPRWLVDNTTMETYEQSSAACLDCHSSAHVSKGRTSNGRVRIEAMSPKAFATLMNGASPTPAPYAADYSFVFGKAK